MVGLSGIALAQDAGIKVRGKVLWQNGYEYVSIVPNDSKSQGKLQGEHPARVSARSLQRALRNLQIRQVEGLFTDTKKTAPLFSDDTAKRLGKRLASALRRAKRNEDILFRIGGQEASFLGSILERNLYTAGRVFWYKNRLHIIFGGIRNSVKRRMIYGRPANLTGEPEEGSRNTETELGFEVVAASGIVYANKKRRDWIAVRPDQTRPPAATGKPGGRGNIEARMRKLRRLLDRDLINEREYRARKRELLDEL